MFPAGAGRRAGTPPRDTVSRGQKHRLPAIPRTPSRTTRSPAPQPSGAETGRFLHPHSLPLQWQTTRSLGFRYAPGAARPFDTTLTADPLLHQAAEAPAREPIDAPATPSALGPATCSGPGPTGNLHRRRRRQSAGAQIASVALTSPTLRRGPPFSTT